MFVKNDSFIKNFTLFKGKENAEQIEHVSDKPDMKTNLDNSSDIFLKELTDKVRSEKMQKPDFQTKIGRQILASYLLTKFKKVISHDKQSEKPLFAEIKPDFLKPLTEHIVNNPNDSIMIAITGESASGKTTISNKIKEMVDNMGLPVTVLSSDNYFKDISHLIKEYGTFDDVRDMGYDIDAPSSFQMDVLKSDLQKLSKGEDIMAPQYLVNGTGISVPSAIPVKANKVVVVDGICSMYEDLPDLFDIKVYVEIPDDERKRRFMKRASERNQDKECARRHWNYLKGAGAKYVKPNKDNCEIVVNGDVNLSYFEELLKYLKLITNNFSEQN